MSRHPQKPAQIQLAERLKLSLYFLQTARVKFESFAASIKNTQLQQAIAVLIEENKRYSIELNLLVLKLVSKAEYIDSSFGKTDPKIEKELKKTSEKAEMLMAKIYGEMLSESYLYNNFKKIISYS